MNGRGLLLVATSALAEKVAPEEHTATMRRPTTFVASFFAEAADYIDDVKIIAWIAAAVLPWSAIIWLFVTFFR